MAQQSVRKSYKYKLFPTPTQERELGRVFGLCRRLYNTALEQRIVAYQRRHFSVSRYQQEAELKDIRAEMSEYAAIHSHVLQDVLARLDKTSQAFYRRVQAGEKAGFPRYQSYDRHRSYTYKGFGNGATLDSGLLVLSKIGRFAVRWSRPLEGTRETVMLGRDADGWYVWFSCGEAPVQPLPSTAREIGLDLGAEAFATLSDGALVISPGWYRKAEQELTLAHRPVSRRKKGGHRRRKAVTALSKAHQQMRRQRLDYHDKVALRLIQTNDVIYHEELPVRHMVQNHLLAKSISDADWPAFLTILGFKAAGARRSVVEITLAFTSQRRSGCGALVAKGLSVRWRASPECGTNLHRDHNAAKNRERAGQARQGCVAVAASENGESIGL